MKRHIHYILIYTLAIIIFFPWTLAASAQGLHDAPYDFLFGNHIDTHQRTLLRVRSGDPVSLFGFFYIIFTGATDPVSGLPIKPAVNGRTIDV